MPEASFAPENRDVNKMDPDPMNILAHRSSFAHQLMVLAEVTNQLSKANSFDELCRQAVLLGRTHLGFERLGIWFEDLPNQQLVGSFGTDEQGNLRDERGQRVPIQPNHPTWVAVHQREIIHQAENFPLYNDKQEVVGQGSSLSAALWDGDDVIGVINADNGLYHRPVTKQHADLLGLYAVNLGHLCSRVRMMETLRHYSERLKGVNQVVVAILEARSLQDIARVVFPHLRHFIPYDRVEIMAFDFEHGQVQVIAVDPDEVPTLLGNTFLLDEFHLDWVLSPEASYRVDLNEAVDVAYLDELAQKGFQSYWSVPLFAKENLFGLLNLCARQKNVFLDEHQRIVQEVVPPLAIWLWETDLKNELQKHAAELEQRVAERTAELQAVNQELESFSYQVSHDLRAPLRAISGFSGLVRNKYGPSLDEVGNDYLDNIQMGVKRMDSLISELLTFSRLSRQPLTKINFFMHDVVREVWKTLADEYATRQIVFTLDDLPACFADPHLIRQVWVNLLSNALKFTRQCPQTNIHIGVEKSEAGYVYWVKDNGTGFDMSFADQIFKPFRRLHSDAEFEGSGIGLAIVQRIIQRHGGWVWAEGEEGKGAKFYFTL
ncbi:MAG TPA: ATP-binding protein [Anaerolineales bacterium]|nr:ATP-binding protein [Anaerolineales bacterium]